MRPTAAEVLSGVGLTLQHVRRGRTVLLGRVISASHGGGLHEGGAVRQAMRPWCQLTAQQGIGFALQQAGRASPWGSHRDEE